MKTAVRERKVTFLFLLGLAAALVAGCAQMRTTAISAPDAAVRAAASRRHEGIPSIAVSPVNGRMWVTWYASATEPRTLHLAGDSTLAWRRPDESSGSWGEALRSNLRPSARICNYAIAGRSTVTFRPQWETNRTTSIPTRRARAVWRVSSWTR